MSEPVYRRREFVGAGVGAAAALAFGSAYWRGAFDDGTSGAGAGPPPVAPSSWNHVDSELTGVTFDPSGSRLYFSSQRAHGLAGEVYEVSGPFRGRRRS